MGIIYLIHEQKFTNDFSSYLDYYYNLFSNFVYFSVYSFPILSEHLASRVDREVLPNAADVAAASEAVARLAHVYGVNATALAAGGRLVLQAVTGHRHHHHHLLSGYLPTFFVCD